LLEYPTTEDDNSMLTVFFDGWPLIYETNSPESMHLLALLSLNPPGVEPVVALPSKPPSWFPKHIETTVHPSPNTPWKRLVWEQRVIPRVFQRRKGDLIHLTMPSVPLSHSSVTVISPSSYSKEISTGTIRRNTRGLWERLREAAAAGAAAQAKAYFWPSDLPQLPDSLSKSPIRLPPLLPSDLSHFQRAGSENSLPDLPENFILYHGPAEKYDLVRLLNSWSWAAGSIGDYYPLLVLGLSDREISQLIHLVKESRLEDSVRILPDISPWQIPDIYKKSSALFHPFPGSPWSGPLRMGLAAQIPIIAAEGVLTSALVKNAAYLNETDDSRAMGAAIITVVIEESVAESLTDAAGILTERWNSMEFMEGLKEAYLEIMKSI
jgi:glycosyltransferase involved in cell wall biosynthesis